MFIWFSGVGLLNLFWVSGFSGFSALGFRAHDGLKYSHDQGFKIRGFVAYSFLQANGSQKKVHSCLCIRFRVLRLRVIELIKFGVFWVLRLGLGV